MKRTHGTVKDVLKVATRAQLPTADTLQTLNAMVDDGARATNSRACNFHGDAMHAGAIESVSCRHIAMQTFMAATDLKRK